MEGRDVYLLLVAKVVSSVFYLMVPSNVSRAIVLASFYLLK